MRKSTNVIILLEGEILASARPKFISKQMYFTILQCPAICELLYHRGNNIFEKTKQNIISFYQNIQFPILPMSWSASTKNNSSKNSHKYKDKQTKYDKKSQINLKGKTKYIPLVPKDALYRQNLFLLSNAQFQETLLKVLKDLNALLYLNQKDFFDQLQSCDSLRVCLQSCLVCLCKNPYYNLSSTKILQQNEQKIDFPNDFFILYEKLNEVVLKIYFRIVNAQSEQHKELIYNYWLLDIPKMIDFCMIYCTRTDSENHFTNLQIVQHIISKAIFSNPKDYCKDFDDFINILYEDKLPFIHRDIKFLINLSPQAMQKASKNFANPLRSFLITSNKILFEIKDLFVMISYVYRCFPKQLCEKLATDHEVLEDTIRIFIEFMQNTPKWKVQSYQKQFKMNFQDIQRAACECYLLNFQILRQIIERGDNIKNDYFSRAMISYSVHCMYLMSDKVNQDYQKIYQRMITTIIQRFKVNDVFFMRQAPSKLTFAKLNEDEKICIQKSFAFVEKIAIKLQQQEEDNSLEMKVKQKIDTFFKKAQKPKQQNKIVYRNVNCGKAIKSLQKEKTQNEFCLESLSDLDFSALNIKQTDRTIDETQEDLELSFDELKSQKQSSNQQSFQTIPTYLFKGRKQLSLISLEQVEKRYELVEQQRKIFQKSLMIQDEDQQEELQAQTNTYYQSNKPQFGEFIDSLIQKEEWIHHFD